MIKSVGGVAINPINRLSCHCGAIVASVALSGINVIQGQKALKVYQFNTKVAKHFFCSHCGIYTHHQRRSYPDQYGYNVGCLEGINPFDLERVPLLDGVNHPADRNA